MRLKVNSEQEYLELVHDLLLYGEHYPCQGLDHSPLDADGLSLFDQFDTIPTDIASEYLGVTTLAPEQREPYLEEDEEGTEWQVELDSIGTKFNSQTGQWDFISAPLYLNPESRYEHPQEKDYPVVIEWTWSDDFDRLGSVKIRMFDWFSIASLEESHIDGQTNIKRKAILWKERYQEKYDEFVARSQGRQIED